MEDPNTELDLILAALRRVDLEALQAVKPDWAQAVAEAKDRLRHLGAK
jgi:hypothetical protein